MIKQIKCIAGLLALSVTLAFVTPSQAAVFPVQSPSWTTTFDPVTGWPSHPDGIQQQDKIWTFISQTGIPTTTTATFLFFQNAGIDQHSLSVGLLGQGNYSLNYSIEVDPAFPLQKISLGSLSVDPDHSTGSWSVTKTFYDISGVQIGLPLTIDNTSPLPNPEVTAISNLSYVNVVETWSVGVGSTIVTTTNVFEQSTVPEPASVAVWTMLAGVGIVVGTLRARKLKQAKVAE
jgi:hypothetical protein